MEQSHAIWCSNKSWRSELLLGAGQIIQPRVIAEIGFRSVSDVKICEISSGLEKNINELPLFVANADVVVLKRQQRLVILSFVQEKAPTHVNIFRNGNNLLHAEIAFRSITVNDRYHIRANQAMQTTDVVNLRDMKKIQFNVSSPEDFGITFAVEFCTVEFNVNSHVVSPRNADSDEIHEQNQTENNQGTFKRTFDIKIQFNHSYNLNVIFR